MQISLHMVWLFHDEDQYHRNQSIDLLRKSIDWFLYYNGLRYERVKDCNHMRRAIKHWLLNLLLLKNRQKYFKSLALWTLQDFESMVIFQRYTWKG